MKRRILVGVMLVLGTVWAVAAAELPVIFVQTEAGFVEVSLSDFPMIEGTVTYEGPASEDGVENWKSTSTYRGISVLSILESVGGILSSDTLGVVAIDGWYKMLPNSVLSGETVAGVPILALERDGLSGDDWEDGPMLIFLPEDETFGNQDMLDALGPEFSHYFGDKPSTTGMMVKGATYLVPNYDGATLPLQPEVVSVGTASFPGGNVLTVVRGADSLAYTLEEVEAFETISGQGTFTTSTNAEYTASYVGVPMTTFIGNVNADATIRVTAADGYSMNYPATTFQDVSEGTWILAYKENDEYIPFDPGYFRIVLVGDDTPHFPSALSAKMVVLIEVLGVYVDYSLDMTGAVDRTFSRSELEEGVGCPCHTATVFVTSKGVTSEYTGIPLWRLIAFIDDGVYPAAYLGLHYNDSDFNDELASSGYTIDLVASDGYTQTVASDLMAHDDRFIVAFKKDGAFLDPESNGYMRFVFDDSVELPEESNLRAVKFLAEILLGL